jgi:hypothetical protein
MIALTRETVLHCAAEHSWTARAKTIERAATRYVEGSLSAAERQAALDLFRLAVDDGEPLVRRVLAESIKYARDLPRDVVEAIACDVPEVSAPFLAASPLVGDDEHIAGVPGPCPLARPRFAPRDGRDQATPCGVTEARDASRSSGTTLSPSGTRTARPGR